MLPLADVLREGHLAASGIATAHWTARPRGLRTTRMQVVGMRDYVPEDDEPTDFDEYYDIPAQTEKDMAIRAYIKIERDPERAGALARRQGEALMEVLRWAYDNRAELRVEAHTLPESWPE
jgi:hypothetical protein